MRGKISAFFQGDEIIPDNGRSGCFNSKFKVQNLKLAAPANFES
jgi:hypothetical protein